MSGTILHEYIHAHIHEHLYHLGYLTNQVGPNSDLWRLFVQSNYPDIEIGDTQHQIMAQAFLNDMAQALHDMNGGIGDPSDYLFIAWEGLRDSFTEEQLNTFDFIPDFDELLNDFNTNVRGQGAINYNNCN